MPQHSPRTPTWASVAAQRTDVNVASVHGTDHRHWTSTMSSVVIWATNIKCPLFPLGSRTSYDLGYLSKGNSQALQGQHGSQRSFEEVQLRKPTILHLGHRIVAQNQGECAAEQPVCVSTSSRQLCPLCWPYSVRTCSSTHCRLLSYLSPLS